MELIDIFVQNVLPIFIVAGVGFLMVRYLAADVDTVPGYPLCAHAMPCFRCACHFQCQR